MAGNGFVRVPGAIPDTAGETVRQDYIGGAALVSDIIPAPLIVPKVGVEETGEIFIDALTTAQIVGVKVTINPGDPVVAASRLAAGAPDTVFIRRNDAIEIVSNSDLFSVVVAAVANTDVVEATYDPVTKIATATKYTNTLAADYSTIMVGFDFDVPVRRVLLGLSTFSDGSTQDNQGIFRVIGGGAA